MSTEKRNSLFNGVPTLKKSLLLVNSKDEAAHEKKNQDSLCLVVGSER